MNTNNTKGMIRKGVAVIALALCALQGMAQITYRIDESIAFPDLRVKISPDASFPDIAVSISKDIAFEDFTVAMTSNRSLADFIISDSQLSDISVNASATVAFADVTVKYGASVPFTNVKVKLIDYGNADYLVYTERSSVTLQEIVVAILPALNKAMHFKFGKIPVYSGDFKQPKRNMNQLGTIDINSADILLILKDAKIYAQDKKGTYLGKIASEYDSESIFNEYVQYGSEFGASSIWNNLSEFGSETSTISPFNPTSTTPPRIQKDGVTIGYLSVCRTVNGVVSPYFIKSLKDKF